MLTSFKQLQLGDSGMLLNHHMTSQTMHVGVKTIWYITIRIWEMVTLQAIESHLKEELERDKTQSFPCLNA